MPKKFARETPSTAHPLAVVAPRAAARVRAILAGIPRGRPVLAGVSGGRDSVLLVRLLRAEGFRRITICHLDHGLRGSASRRDAAFVQRLAEELGCDYASTRVDIQRAARRDRQSVETKGRAARRALFARVARTTGARLLFLGHHADDRIETLLWNLLRGAGTRGLSALRPIAHLPLDGLRMRVVRPLIPLLRSEIDAATQAGGWAYREDATNLDLEPTRNRIRHELIPALERIVGRPVRETLRRAAEVLQAEDDWMEAQLPRRTGATLPVHSIRELPVPLQRRHVARWLTQRGATGIGFDEIEAVRGLAESDRPSRVQLPGNRFAVRSKGTLRVVERLRLGKPTTRD